MTETSLRTKRYREAVPEYDQPLTEASGLVRIVARNPGPMTYHGTNTWLVESKAGWVVVDPGPEDAVHQEAILKASNGRIHMIAVTHHHHDHEGGARTLALRSGAALYGGSGGRPLIDGQELAGLRVIATPGHTMDHVCFDLGERRLLAGDHIMGWSTSVVLRAPHGSMGLYLANLKKIRALNYKTIFSGHGPAITDPEPFIKSLIRTRETKIDQTLALLNQEWQTETALLSKVYSHLSGPLLRAAGEMLGSTLEELENRNLARRDPNGWAAA